MLLLRLAVLGVEPARELTCGEARRVGRETSLDGLQGQTALGNQLLEVGSQFIPQVGITHSGY